MADILYLDHLKSETVCLNKLDATAAPTVNDDSDSDYEPGSFWVDVTNDKVCQCVDATVGAAVWTEITQAGGGGGGAGILEIQVFSF